MLSAAIDKSALFGDLCDYGGYDMECQQGEFDGIFADDDVARGSVYMGVYVHDLVCWCDGKGGQDEKDRGTQEGGDEEEGRMERV